MLKVGDHVIVKPNLTLGRKYGTVTFGKYHVQYMHKVLKVYKISSSSTAYCSHNGFPCECGTFSEPMLNVARFKPGDVVKIVYTSQDAQTGYIGQITEIKSVRCEDYDFIYHITDDCGVFDWKETDLELYTEDKNLEELSITLENNENQLQGKDFNIRSGERVKGSRVHGRISQASIRSRPLRDAQSIRGK